MSLLDLAHTPVSKLTSSWCSRLVILVLCLLPSYAKAQQPVIVDEIVAIIGDHIILKSDIDKEFETIKEQGNEDLKEEDKMVILDQLIIRKLLLHQSQVDSVKISADRVDQELERRLAYILMQFNNDEEQFTRYLGKSIAEFKSSTRPKLEEQMLVEEMKEKLLKDTRITPSEVRKYYDKVSIDSIPYVNAQYKIAFIEKKAKVSDAAKDYAREKIEGIRQQVLNGADFALMARTHSEDASSGNGGELGYFVRGQMVPEFEAAAYKLKKDSISPIVESQYGFHILQLVDRRGERINVRHILIKPKLVSSDLMAARNLLDSIYNLIRIDTLKFENAAKLYSDDEHTKGQGGLMNDVAGNYFLSMDELDKSTFLSIKDLHPGEMTPPLKVDNEDGSAAYRIYKIVEELPPHRLNPKDDYLKLQKLALEHKKNETLNKWVEKNRYTYFIKINPRYEQHPALSKWTQK